MISRVREVAGRNWLEQLASLRMEAYACNAAYEAGQPGPGLTDADAIAVEAEIQDRHRREDRARSGHQYRASVPGRAASIVEGLARAIEAGPYDPEPLEPAPPPTSVPIVPRKPRRVIPQDEAGKRAKVRERRLYLAAVAGLPAAVAQFYTTAQQAVWSQILIEIQTTGSCELAVGALAHRARVSRRVVQSTRRRACERGHLAMVETVRAPNRLTVICSTILDWLSGLPAKRKRSPESKKSLVREYLTHPQQGENARTHPRILPPEAPPEPAPVEAVPEPIPEPKPAQAPPEAVVGACEPAPVAAPVKPPPPPLREPDVWDRILVRAGLTPRGCHPVAEPGAG